MSTTTWNTTTINGRDYLVIDTASFRIPLDWDPASSMFIAVAAPTGGLGSFPALVKGDPGDAPTIETSIDLTMLEPGDATADSAVWTLLAENDYQLSLTLHKGDKGDAGTATLDVDDFGTPVAGKIIVVNATLDGFVYQSQKCGDRYIPATISAAPSGNPAYTLAAVSVPAQPWDWRPEVSGQCVITGTGTNVAVNLVARLNDQVTGNIVGQGIGLAGRGPDNVGLFAGPPAGSGDSYDLVAANSLATIYLRAERTSGTDTFTTSGSTTTFQVRVCPIP